MSWHEPSGRRVVVAIVMVAAGSALGAVAAGVTGIPARDALLLAAFAAAGSVAAMVSVIALGRVGWGRSLRTRLATVAIVSSAAMASGVVLAARAMFISAHDLGALLVVVAVAAALAAASAVVLAGRVTDEVAELTGLARRLGRVEAANATTGATEVTEGCCSLVPAGRIDSAELVEVATALAESHDRLTRSRRRERALDSSRRELVAWVSHDLRSPIASVRAMAEALEDGVVDDAESIARYHRAIRSEAERLGNLVDDLFELSRITSGVAATSEVDLVPLDELLVEVVEGATGSARQRGVDLAHRIAGEPPLVSADLRRVLRNLVDNAVSATSQGGTVTVHGRLDPDRDGAVTLDVTDECGGIDPDVLPRLFEVGFRGDAARQRDDGGGGLGLAIARGLLEAHAGQISVANDGPGCRFTVRIPVAAAS